MANSGLPAYGTIEFIEDTDGDVAVILNGNFTALVGREVEARPIKVHEKTILAEIDKIDVDGEIVDKADLVFGNPSVSDIVSTLQDMNPGDQQTAISALSGNKSRYEAVMSFVASRVPGKVDFKVIG